MASSENGSDQLGAAELDDIESGCPFGGNLNQKGNNNANDEPRQNGNTSSKNALVDTLANQESKANQSARSTNQKLTAIQKDYLDKIFEEAKAESGNSVHQHDAQNGSTKGGRKLGPRDRAQKAYQKRNKALTRHQPYSVSTTSPVPSDPKHVPMGFKPNLSMIAADAYQKAEEAQKEREHMELTKKREQNAKDAKNSFDKKNATLMKNLELAETNKNKAGLLEADNIASQSNLKFAVHILLNFGNSSSMIDYSAFKEIEMEKKKISKGIEEEIQTDVELQRKGKKRDEAIAKWEQHVFDKDHKDVLPVYIWDENGRHKAADITLTSRVFRSEQAKETIEAAYEAAIHEFEIKRQQQTSLLLSRQWKYYGPFLRTILDNPPVGFQEGMESAGHTVRLQHIRQTMFNPG